MFNDKKYPTATKVRCPKCKGTQPLNASDGGAARSPVEEEEDLDWFRPKESANVSSPVIRPSVSKPRPAQPQGIGWLIIHDEYTDTYTFDLRKGINRIGRESASTPRDVNIIIHTKLKCNGWKEKVDMSMY